MDAVIDVAMKWIGHSVMCDFYDPDNRSTPLGKVEIRLPDGGEPYIASEDNLGRNLLPLKFAYNSYAAVVDIPIEVYDRLSDPRCVPILNRFGRSDLGGADAYTFYGAGW